MGVHLDKVLTSITADTEIIAYEKNGQDTTWTSTDSINFTVTTDHSLKFRVYTYDLKKGLPYTVKINRHTQDPDSISWKSFDDMQFGKDVIKQKQSLPIIHYLFSVKTPKENRLTSITKS